MKRSLTAGFLLLLALASPAFAKDGAFVFATPEQGAEILRTRDDYIRSLSPFDRAAKMKTDQTVSEDAFVAFSSSNTVAWADADKAKLQPLLDDIRVRIDALPLQWPQQILFVKTTGQEEGNAAYTRANAIFLPPSQLGIDSDRLRVLIAHELFHVLSRQNPALRNELYAAIGYHPCGPVVLPPKFAALRISNPDAPVSEHCIRVRLDGANVLVTPVLLSRAEKFDVAKGGTFFNYVEVKFLRMDSSPPTDANVRLADVKELEGFAEQIGRNTGYIIHPEETVADNFAIMLLGRPNIPSPEIVQKVKDIITRAR